jgi:transcription antitermination factor NusG
VKEREPLKIGDPWPFRSARGLTGRPLAKPVWYALVVAPQTEAKISKQLENAGVKVLYPVDSRVRHHHGRKYEYEVPIISRIVYARFEFSPQWDVLKERRIITGVFCDRNRPVIVPENVVRIIMGLPLEEDRLEQERIAAMTPEVGEQVILATGPFKGFCVDVVKTEAGRVWYKSVTNLGVVDGSAEITGIERLAVESKTG